MEDSGGENPRKIMGVVREAQEEREERGSSLRERSLTIGGGGLVNFGGGLRFFERPFREG